MPENTNPSQHDVFISFSSDADLATAEFLAALLKEVDISSYFYPVTNRLNAESDFALAIPRYLAGAKVVVCVLSVASCKSQYIRNELAMANELRLPVIPILMPGLAEPPRDIKFHVGSRLWAAIADIKLERELLIKRIMEAIAGKERPKEGRRRSLAKPRGKGEGAVAPYVGPKPFDDATSGLYVGREFEIDALNWHLDEGATRVVVIYGPSGTGKSSLLMAGLIPKLRAIGYDVPTTRSGPPRLGRLAVEDVADDDKVIIFSNSLILELSGDPSRQPGRFTRLASFLESLGGPRQTRKGRVLVLDQFEEIFFEQFDSRYEDRRRFILDLKEALQFDPDLRIVLSLRKEYVVDIRPLLADFAAVGRPFEFELAPMGEEAAWQAIAEPAAPYIRFEDAALEKLVTQLREVTVRAPDGRKFQKRLEFIELAHLQVVCLRLWKSLPQGAVTVGVDDLDKLSGGESVVSNALGEYYDEVVADTAKLTSFSRDWILLGCAQFVSARETRVQLPSQGGRVGRLPDRVVKLLETKFLLRRVYRGRDSWFELSHDLLIAPVMAHREKAPASLLMAGQHLDQIRDQAIMKSGSDLTGFFDKHRDLQDECLPLARQHGLFDVEIQLLFRSSLAAGEGVLDWAAFMSETEELSKKLRQVLSEAIVNDSAAIRGHAVDVICEQRVRELYPAVTRMAVSPEQHAMVRSAAASGIALVDDPLVYRQLIEDGKEAGKPALALDALSLVAVRSQVSETEAKRFPEFATTLEPTQRRQIVLKSVWTRFRAALPLLLIVFLFGAAFSGAPALFFKAIPSSKGWGVAQHEPSLVIGAFQGAVASLFWAGFVSTSITLFYSTFANAKLRRSAWSPFGAVIAGIIGSLIASMLIIATILGVFHRASLRTMGWIVSPAWGGDAWSQAFFTTRYGWVYLVMGAGVGIGLALVSNSIRASKSWALLLRESTDRFSSLDDVARTYKNLLKMAARRPFLLVVPMMALSCTAYFIPVAEQGSPFSNQHVAASLRAADSKANPADLALGIFGDLMTQIVGAFFGGCGALLGGVVVRRGFSIEPLRVGFGVASRRQAEETAEGRG